MEQNYDHFTNPSLVITSVHQDLKTFYPHGIVKSQRGHFPPPAHVGATVSNCLKSGSLQHYFINACSIGCLTSSLFLHIPSYLLISTSSLFNPRHIFSNSYILNHSIMIGFSTLPEELILSILHYLQIADLLSLSLVCKVLQRIAIPRIYRDVNWTWDEDAKDDSTVQSFLRSILERPQLALMVKHIQFRGFKFSDWLHLELGDHVMQLARNIIARVGYPIADKWMFGLQYGSLVVIIALVLSQLPNLESLEVGRFFLDETLFCELFHHAAVSSPLRESSFPAFRSLQIIKYSGAPYLARLADANLDRILPLFYLPSLRTLSTYIRGDEFFAWP